MPRPALCQYRLRRDPDLPSVYQSESQKETLSNGLKTGIESHEPFRPNKEPNRSTSKAAPTTQRLGVGLRSDQSKKLFSTGKEG